MHTGIPAYSILVLLQGVNPVSGNQDVENPWCRIILHCEKASSVVSIMLPFHDQRWQRDENDDKKTLGKECGRIICAPK